MKGFKPLTLKGVFKKHRSNPQDQPLHAETETKGIKKNVFSKLIQESTKHEPFDKKKN